MCGICGLAGGLDPMRLDRMLAALAHRGPDDRGVFQDAGVALGMTRLAVIDTSAKAHQPMASDDGDIWIVYNGETYNFKEERRWLQGRGIRFRSDSDTEVVLKLYELLGTAFLKRLRGIFAMAIYDRRPGEAQGPRLVVARDHLGVKPLLYARVGAGIVFASEIKALLASGLVNRTLDLESLRLLLTRGHIPQPHTAIEGVKMLPPGSVLVWGRRGMLIERFWQPAIDRVDGLRRMAYEGQVEWVREALEETVRSQLVSDVPIGAFLSGGVDSTLLVALMRRLHNGRVKTFSVGFAGEAEDLDESDDAQKVARFLDTDHSKVTVTGEDVCQRLPHIVGALDQPSVDGVNSYFVSWAASRAVTVAISGTGGDELFGGYPWFVTMQREMRRRASAPRHWALWEKIANLCQHRLFDPVVSGRMGSRLAYGVEALRSQAGFAARFAREQQIFGAPGAAGVLSQAVREAIRCGEEPSGGELQDLFSGSEPVDRVTGLLLEGYLLNQLLRDIDATSMAHSLEVRVPFLDPAFVDLALSLSPETKLAPFTSESRSPASTYRQTGAKRILVDVGRAILPEGLDLQRKRGFNLPMDVWLKTSLRTAMEDTLCEHTVKGRGLFAVATVNRIRGQFSLGRVHWSLPWLLMVVEIWCREVLEAPQPTLP